MSDLGSFYQKQKNQNINLQPLTLNQQIQFDQFEVKSIDINQIHETEQKQLHLMEKELSSLKLTFDTLMEQLEQLKQQENYIASQQTVQTENWEEQTQRFKINKVKSQEDQLFYQQKLQ